jgi:hypothetical protein
MELKDEKTKMTKKDNKKMQSGKEESDTTYKVKKKHNIKKTLLFL